MLSIFVFFEFWHWTWSLIGMILNSLLIYVAIFKSPKAIQSYATLIINFALTDFIECTLDWFLQPRLIPAPGDVTITYIMNGVCKYIDPFACKFGISLFLHCFPHSVWSLLLSFGYRFYILNHSALSRKSLMKILMIVYIPSLFQGMTYWTTFVSREKILPFTKTTFPNYNFELETGVITGIMDATNWAAAYGISHLCLPIFPVYIAIFILRRKIIRHLNENTQMMAPETKSAHSQLLKALTFQACIPAFMGFAVTFYVLAQSGLMVSPILEYGVFASVILMPTLSPLTYLCFVRPYRQFVRRVFEKTIWRKNQVEATGSKSIQFDSGGHQTQILAS